MSCSKCNKEKREIVTRCWNCNEFIYKGDLIYEISKSKSGGFNFWLGLRREQTEKVVQCDKCYQSWRNKLKKRGKWWKWWKVLIMTTLVFFSLGSLFYLFFPNKWEQIIKQLKKLKGELANIHWVLYLILFIFTIFFLIIMLKEPEADRYEIIEKKYHDDGNCKK